MFGVSMVNLVTIADQISGSNRKDNGCCFFISSKSLAIRKDLFVCLKLRKIASFLIKNIFGGLFEHQLEIIFFIKSNSCNEKGRKGHVLP